MSLRSSSWQTLTALAENADKTSIVSLLADESRVGRYSQSVDGLHVDYSKHLVSDEVMAELVQLAVSCDVEDHRKSLFDGDIVNQSEQRAALHFALRNPEGSANSEVISSMQRERAHLEKFSNDIRSGKLNGSTGKPFTDIINIGIGGSDLGPKMLCAALREFGDGPDCHFISNVDGAEILSLLPTLDAQTTLVIISSKSFTTGETLQNASTATDWLKKSLAADDETIACHLAAVTCDKSRALSTGIPESNILTMPETIGGRYSLWSAMSLAVCIHIGYGKFSELLAGGAAMDEHFLTTPLRDNLPVVMALLGIWYSNFLGIQSYAVVPYCDRLGLFIDHLQQLDMESNGKSARTDEGFINHDSGPVVWGKPGTNAQHAFFQMLHQGPRWLPVDFIGVIHDNLSNDSHHKKLLTNLVAQSEALMLGRESSTSHNHYPGNRPSSTLLLDELTPYNLGLLVALYEHKIFVQAVIWGINPFDQWGVELGKQLADALQESGENHDASTLDLIRRTGLQD